MKTFTPVSRMFDNEDDIFIFSGNVWNPALAKYYFKKKNQNYYEILTSYEWVENNQWQLFVISEWIDLI